VQQQGEVVGGLGVAEVQGQHCAQRREEGQFIKVILRRWSQSIGMRYCVAF
jgi:hypothetical protein